MIDRNFANFESVPVQQNRDESVQLTIQRQIFHGFIAIRLKPAIEVIQFDSADAADDAIEKLRWQGLVDRVMANMFPPRDNVITLGEFCQEIWDLGRVILEISVHRENDIARRDLKPRV